jgi:hypothetical protein
LGSVVGNTWKGDFYSNTIGNDFYGNSFYGEIYENTIGNGFQTNEIKSYFNNNVIGDNFGYGYAAPQGNKIGNNFYDNTIGEYFYNNTIPDNFYNNHIGNYFQWNVVNTNISNTDFTLNYGNITGFTFTTTGSTASDNLYNNIQICGTTTSTYGVLATFDIEVVSGAVIGVSGSSEGKLYEIGDELTILGTQIGGVVPDDNIVITVTGVTSGSLFYDHYTKQIFERKGGNKRVSYYDEDDILNVDSIYLTSGYIDVYSQALTFPINNASFEYWCDGIYNAEGLITSQTVNNMSELVTLFNTSLGVSSFFDNNDGTLGLYIEPSAKNQLCPTGALTLNVFND